MGDETSEPIRLTRGEPGSVFGPSVFSLDVAPLEDIIKSYGLNCAVYADDTQLYISIDKSPLQSSISYLQKCIKALLEWLADNELVCNESKTNVVQLSSRFKQHDLLSEITIGKSNVVLSSSVHDLGVTLDCHLDMNAPVNP